MEIFKQLAGFTDAERLRCRSSIENFERGFACIAVGTRDAMKLLVADFGGSLQRAKDYGPADLQRAWIALSKRLAGEVACHDRKLLAR